MRKLILSLCLLLAAGFFLQAKTNKEFVIAIHAGHGGADNGAKAIDGALEKNLTLAYAQELEKLATAQNFKVILCRDTDQDFDLTARAAFVKQHQADLFISIHFNASLNDAGKRGFECYVGTQTNLVENRILGKFIGAELYNIAGMKFNGVNIQTQPMLTLNTIPSPVALLELGYLTNEKDYQFIKTAEGRTEICQKLLNAIQLYKKQIETNK